MTTCASVELGGTKTLVGIGSGPDDLSVVERVPTGDDPHDTMAAVISAIEGTSAKGLGVASFGPLTLDSSSSRFGMFESTPKSGWSGFDVLGELSRGTGLQTAIETDVNAAALAEGRWGAARNHRHHAYVTVGTGIGFGVVSDESPVMGSAHPEMGHIAVARHTDDEFAGVCPYHGDCLEGMASGPALAMRLGTDVENLDSDLQSEACDLAAFYLGQGLRALSYSFAPEVVVVGGGVSHLDGFHEAAERSLRDSLSGYREPTAPLGRYVVPPGLGDLSGLAGGLILAMKAKG